jgi:HD-GYP domain-containing protein (c-di-GMP phosphodiesterase class II)
MKINIAQLLINLSRSLDWSGQGLLAHHQHVAFMSMELGQAAGMKGNALIELFKAAIVHDIGALSWSEKEDLLFFDVQNTPPHCQRGYSLLQGSYLNSIAPIIRTHHDRWSGVNLSGLVKETIPLASRIIHLTDRVDVLIRNDRSILEQRNDIMAHIQDFSGSYFDPDLVALMQTLATNESLWLTATTPGVLDERILDLIPSQILPINMPALYSIAILFSKIIDSKSPFTYRHSNGVAIVAKFLAASLACDQETCRLIEIAALLHDVGKLTVPSEILQKPGPLSPHEFNIIKHHPFYTYNWLRPAMPSLPIAEWAAFHHEQLGGNGYPFHKTAVDLDMHARIMAVADVFAALREDRPYRQSLSWPEIIKILNAKTRADALDGDIVAQLVSSRDELEGILSEPAKPVMEQLLQMPCTA